METAEKNIMNNARKIINSDGLSPKMIHLLIKLERQEAQEELLDKIKAKIKYQKINGHGSLVKGLCRNDIKYILEILQELEKQ